MRTLFICALIFLSFSCRKKNEKSQEPVNAIVNSRDFRKLTIEIVYEKDVQFQQSTLQNLRDFLSANIDKPSGIEISQRNLQSAGTGTYSLAELQSMEQAHRTENNDGENATAYVFVVNAEYEDPNVLGIAYGESSIVIFEKTILKYAGGLGQPPAQVVESSVIEHEFGHIMGLVNNGVSMQNDHQDQAHGKHCNNKNCLMYYATETSDIIGNLLGGKIPQLDAACTDDLSHERSK